MGTTSATAYVADNEYAGIDLNGDGDKQDTLLRLAVNSTVMQTSTVIINHYLVLGSPLFPSPELFVRRDSITIFDRQNGRIVQLLANGVITEQPLVLNPWVPSMETAIPFGTGAVGFGRYLLTAEGKLVDSGLVGLVRGESGGLPVVQMLIPPPFQSMPSLGEWVLATTPPTPLAPSATSRRFQTATRMWIATDEQHAHRDLNADGDLADPTICEVTATGINRCLSSNLDVQPDSWHRTGADGMLFDAIDLSAPVPRIEKYHVGAETGPVSLGPGVRFDNNLTTLGTTSVLISTTEPAIPVENSLVRTRLVGELGVGAVFDERRLGSNAPEAARAIGDGRFIANFPENGADLNGDGDTTDLVAHLIDHHGMTNMRVSASMWSLGRVAAPLAGSAFAFSVEERTERRDLNGDGDVTDRVVHVWSDGSVTNLRIAHGDSTLPVDDPFASTFAPTGAPGELEVGVSESVQGPINGDGDTDDSYTFRITSRPLAGLVTPARLLDTRNGIGYTGPKPVAGQTLDIQVAGQAGVPTADVAAVAINVTMTGSTDEGFVTVWGDGIRPNTSNLNVNHPDQTIANLVIAPVGADGKIHIYASGGGHLIADVVAWFRSHGPYRPTAPIRLLDTRAGGQVGYRGPNVQHLADMLNGHAASASIEIRSPAQGD